MPAAIAHYLLSTRVLNALHQADMPERDAFFWGAQGPDFLFTHRLFPWQKGDSMKDYGGKIHSTPPSQTLGAMRFYLTQHQEDREAYSYIQGFLCHYALDSIAHPFVNCGAVLLNEQLQNTTIGSCHNEIEASLDVIVLRYETAQLPSEVKLKNLIPNNQAVIDAMARVYTLVFSRAFEVEISENAIKQACKDFRTAFSWMTDRTGLKRQLFSRIERKKTPRITSHLRPLTEEGEYDWANILNGEWRWPMDSGEIHTESFLELYEQAVQKAQALIKGFLAGDDLTVLTNEIPFG